MFGSTSLANVPQNAGPQNYVTFDFTYIWLPKRMYWSATAGGDQYGRQLGRQFERDHKCHRWGNRGQESWV